MWAKPWAGRQAVSHANGISSYGHGLHPGMTNCSWTSSSCIREDNLRVLTLSKLPFKSEGNSFSNRILYLWGFIASEASEITESLGIWLYFDVQYITASLTGKFYYLNNYSRSPIKLIRNFCFTFESYLFKGIECIFIAHSSPSCKTTRSKTDNQIGLKINVGRLAGYLEFQF